LFQNVHYFILSVALSPACVQRDGGFTQAGAPKKFGRAINFQIPTKLSAGVCRHYGKPLGVCRFSNRTSLIAFLIEPIMSQLI